MAKRRWLAYDQAVHKNVVVSRLRFLVVLVLACTACAGATDPVRSDDALPAIEPRSSAAPAGQTAPGMRVYLDPQTGLPATPPPGFHLEDPNAGRPVSDLREEAVPGGGFKVELEGRLQNYTRPSEGEPEDR